MMIMTTTTMMMMMMMPLLLLLLLMPLVRLPAQHYRNVTALLAAVVPVAVAVALAALLTASWMVATLRCVAWLMLILPR